MSHSHIINYATHIDRSRRVVQTGGYSVKGGATLQAPLEPSGIVRQTFLYRELVCSNLLYIFPVSFAGHIHRQCSRTGNFPESIK